ncbi:DUF4839 domain-containing protein [Rhodococcus fascians]|nr:DUF4839 domain-containing protein [Rhodococcus fascians]MBY4396414.1 DUF4839 domain-containing protein [Rhodococcus fascians]MBY4409066.1 DUF4839 domain-containing protein [Rhodococcus fascians]MBY4460269.1 DUF4839 domain-containing protein [Rhodococcus fascians]
MGQNIQFDGHIAAMNNHEDYETRYDILIGARDCDESDGGRPNLQFRDVNVMSDLGLTGPDIPETLGVPDSLRVTAVVEKFEERTCLLLLDPVSAESNSRSRGVGQ